MRGKVARSLLYSVIPGNDPGPGGAVDVVLSVSQECAGSLAEMTDQQKIGSDDTKRKSLHSQAFLTPKTTVPAFAGTVYFTRSEAISSWLLSFSSSLLSLPWP
jgi:hypothetical protein